MSFFVKKVYFYSVTELKRVYQLPSLQRLP